MQAGPKADLLSRPTVVECYTYRKLKAYIGLPNPSSLTNLFFWNLFKRLGACYSKFRMNLARDESCKINVLQPQLFQWTIAADGGKGVLEKYWVWYRAIKIYQTIIIELWKLTGWILTYLVDDWQTTSQMAAGIQSINPSNQLYHIVSYHSQSPGSLWVKSCLPWPFLIYYSIFFIIFNDI